MPRSRGRTSKSTSARTCEAPAKVKTTDYSDIAPVYDANPIRSHWDVEPEIGKALSNYTDRIHVLDLACGTGNFLIAQRAAFPDARIAWFDCDLSADMLARAQHKLPSAALIRADACALPYADDFFQVIVCNFAFHHFREKTRSLREIARVLAPGGVFILNNICPERMPRWWVYRYFPAARRIDRGRFWRNHRLVRALERLGFGVMINATITGKRFNPKDLEAEAANRDMSQLNVVSGARYQRGLRCLRADADRGMPYAGDFALIRLVAYKNEAAGTTK